MTASHDAPEGTDHATIPPTPRPDDDGTLSSADRLAEAEAAEPTPGETLGSADEARRRADAPLYLLGPQGTAVPPPATAVRRRWPYALLALALLLAAVGWVRAGQAQSERDATRRALHHLQVTATTGAAQSGRVLLQARAAAVAQQTAAARTVVALAVAASGRQTTVAGQETVAAVVAARIQTASAGALVREMTVAAAAVAQTEAAQQRALAQALATPTPTPLPRPPFLHLCLADDLSHYRCRVPRRRLERAAFGDSLFLLDNGRPFGTTTLNWRLYQRQGDAERLIGVNTSADLDPSWRKTTIRLYDLFLTMAVPTVPAASSGCSQCGGGGGGGPLPVYEGPDPGTYRIETLGPGGTVLAATQITFVDTRPTPTVTPTDLPTVTAVPTPTADAALAALDSGPLWSTPTLTLCTDIEYNTSSNTCSTGDSTLAQSDLANAHVVERDANSLMRRVQFFLAQKDAQGDYITLATQVEVIEGRYGGSSIWLNNLTSALAPGDYRLTAEVNDADHVVDSDPYYVTVTGAMATS